MSMFGGMEISASALTAQRLRMNVTAENLANAQTTRGADGQPYRRKEVVLQSVAPRRLRRAAERRDGRRPAVAPAASRSRASPRTRRTASSSTTPATRTPTTQGYVTMPNVDTVTEMVDLIDAQRAYEANVTALQASKQMFAKTLEILR